MPVKCFTADSVEGLEEEVNEFIGTRKITNMQMTTSHSEEWGDSHYLIISY